jgi:glycerol uptake facilitator-like aquaporin
MAVIKIDQTCFYERDASLAIFRRATCEAIGTLMLMFTANGSSLIVHREVPSTPLLGLLIAAIATAGALVGVILAFGAVSGGHFNPLITATQWLNGERRLDCTLAYVVAQIMGACLGALLANAVFQSQSHVAAPEGIEVRLILSEFIDSFALMIVVFGCARSGRVESGPFAVGAWLAAAIVATPSSSYANPAIALAALLSIGSLHLSATYAAWYLTAQILGAAAANTVISIAFPRTRVELSGANKGLVKS